MMNFFSVTYFPVITIIEFIAYFGWIKVAETLLYPWGDDDEDFQVNHVIDRNFQVTWLRIGTERQSFFTELFEPVSPQATQLGIHIFKLL